MSTVPSVEPSSTMMCSAGFSDCEPTDLMLRSITLAELKAAVMTETLDMRIHTRQLLAEGHRSAACEVRGVLASQHASAAPRQPRILRGTERFAKPAMLMLATAG